MARTMREIEILERFKGLPKLTDAQRRFLMHDILPYYVFYDRKANTAHCTKCGADFKANEVRELRHNKEGVCPKCGAKVVGKSLGFGHNVIDEGTGVIMNNLDGEVVIRYFYIGRSYAKDIRKPYEYVSELVRDVFNGTKKEEIYDNRNRWRRVYWQECYTGYSGPHWGFHVKREFLSEHYALYHRNLKDVFRGTRYEHCEFDTFFSHFKSYGKTPWRWGNYLAECDKSNLWEYLMKMRMFDFAKILLECHRHYDRVKLDYNASTLQGILRITRPQLAELHGMKEPSIRLLKYWQEGLQTKDFNDYGEMLDADKCKELLANYRFSAQKFREYCEEHQFNNVWQRSDYIDYLAMCKRVGRDMRNTMVVFPRHFKEAHDAVLAEINKQKLEAKDSVYQEARKLLEQFNYKGDGLCVVVPEHCADIANEGIALHHCVGTYIDKVCDKQTAILFVRNLKEMGKPFYTMEVCNGKLIQCRGANNCNMTKEVKAFVKKFCKAKRIAA